MSDAKLADASEDNIPLECFALDVMVKPLQSLVEDIISFSESSIRRRSSISAISLRAIVSASCLAFQVFSS